MRRIVSALAASAVIGTGLAVAGPASPAAADEVFPVPATGSMTVRGHGYGHGYGLSQYGSYGAATSGLSASSILNFYYPNTAQAVQAEAPVRIRLTAPSTSVTVAPATGLAVRDVATGDRYVLPSGPQQWRLVIDSSAMRVQSLNAGVWSTVRFPDGRNSFAGPLRFEGPPSIKLILSSSTAREYDGTITGLRSGSTTMYTINTLSMELYLRGVVPKESPSSWPAAALQAQSVAARSYSSWHRADSVSDSYDLCDTTACQVYGGKTLYNGSSVIPQQASSTNAAISATANVVRTYNGRPILAQFSSSNGGYTTGNPSVPYYVAKRDPYDPIHNPYANWEADLSAAQLRACYPSAGTPERVVITSRDGVGQWGGRVLGVRIEGRSSAGSPTSYATTGSSLRSCAGLRSNYFTLVGPPATSGLGISATSQGGLHLFRRTSNGSVAQHSWTPGPGWSTERNLGGVIVGGPSAVGLNSGRQLLAVRGANNVLYTREATGSTWGDWQPVGGVLGGRPTAAFDGTTVTALAPGSSGGVLYLQRGADGTWSPWASLGGRLQAGTGPAATSSAPGSVSVVAVGTDGQLYLQTRTAGEWTGWSSLGGRAIGDPAVASLGAGRLAVFVRGTDSQLWYRAYANGAWSGWTSLGGGLAAGPTATARDGRMDVAVLSPNGRSYVRTYTGEAWHDWYLVPQ